MPWPTGSDFSRTALQHRYHRASRKAGVLPLDLMAAEGPDGCGVLVTAAALTEWPNRDIAGLIWEVTSLWPEIAPFLPAIQSPDDMTVARYSHSTLRRPCAEALVHISDAAHRASPQLGQGADMTLLDALALAQAMTSDDPGPQDARARRWQGRLNQAMSAGFTPQYQSDSRWLPMFRDRMLMPVSRIPPVPRILTRLVAGDLIPPIAGLAFP